MSDTLTTKQEKFVQEWYATGNKTEAYRRAYNAKNMTSKTINERASRLSTETKISARYAQLMEVSQERSASTVHKLDAMLNEAYQAAREASKPSAMVSACMALMKLHGHDAETRNKLENGTNGPDMAEWLRELALMLPD